MKLEQGKKYELTLNDETQEGIFINETKQFIYIKLKSGYNIGIKKTRIKEAKQK